MFQLPWTVTVSVQSGISLSCYLNFCLFEKLQTFLIISWEVFTFHPLSLSPLGPESHLQWGQANECFISSAQIKWGHRDKHTLCITSHFVSLQIYKEVWLLQNLSLCPQLKYCCSNSHIAAAVGYCLSAWLLCPSPSQGIWVLSGLTSNTWQWLSYL